MGAPTDSVTTTDAAAVGVPAPDRPRRPAAAVTAEQSPVAVLTGASPGTGLYPPPESVVEFTDVMATHGRGIPIAHAKLRRRRTPTEGSSTMSPPKPLRDSDTGRGEAHGFCDDDDDNDDEYELTGVADAAPAEGDACVGSTACAEGVAVPEAEKAEANGILPGVNDDDSVPRRLAEEERDGEAARLSEAVNDAGVSIAIDWDADCAALLSTTDALVV